MNILTCKRNYGIKMTRKKGNADCYVNISSNSPGIALRAYIACITTLGTLDTFTGC